jgi:hypothetical protein
MGRRLLARLAVTEEAQALARAAAMRPREIAEELQEIARTIGVASRILPGAGHINIAAGYGPWPFVLDWVRDVGAR